MDSIRNGSAGIIIPERSEGSNRSDFERFRSLITAWELQISNCQCQFESNKAENHILKFQYSVLFSVLGL
jgi:hypothetical protein